MRHRAWLLVLLLMPMFLGGCWSRRELNELSIASAIGIDRQDDQYLLSVQVVNPSSIAKKQGDNTTPIIVYSAKGVSLNEAVRRLTSSISRKIFFSHIRIVVLSEEVAKRGIAKPVDFLMRGNEIRSDFTVLIAKGDSAKDVLGVTTPMEKISANFIFNALEVANKEWSPVASVKLDDLSNLLLGTGMSPVLSGVRVVGDPAEGRLDQNVKSATPPVRIQHTGIGIFKQDKLVGWLNERESRGYSVLTNRVRRSSVHLVCPEGGIIGIDTSNVKADFKGKIIDNKPQVWVDVQYQGNISSVECPIDLSDPSVLEQMNHQLEAFGQTNMEQVIRKAQSLGTDIFGFGLELHRVNPTYWKQVERQWDEEFKKLVVHLQVKAMITGTGTISESPVRKMEEDGL
ncbi:spore germination protein KC [Paenibacillus phyllosphaerae]|uniref:Spore germination protein KC n=1 Tax=Paenibacillus phyllosphaerae TaxID=274593 RepID=A0A7W5B1I6_9BACL|nr:Ger(x)C family spore germination protein [Paenibacillus phyllosphaerae]MBB3112643.1 spore germination protein KC [Paenibacillus phyllosphaerae]